MWRFFVDGPQGFGCGLVRAFPTRYGHFTVLDPYTVPAGRLLPANSETSIAAEGDGTASGGSSQDLQSYAEDRGVRRTFCQCYCSCDRRRHVHKYFDDRHPMHLGVCGFLAEKKTILGNCAARQRSCSAEQRAFLTNSQAETIRKKACML